jgi:tetratricopeptide (TPR) repeat protein
LSNDLMKHLMHGRFLAGILMGAGMVFAALNSFPIGSGSGVRSRSPQLRPRGHRKPEGAPAPAPCPESGKIAAASARASKKGARRLWMAHATLCALTGADRELQHAAEQAIRRGANPKKVLALFRDLPKSARAGAMEGLVARLKDVEWDTSQIAAIYGSAGLVDRATAMLEQSILEEDDPCRAITALVKLDPVRAAARLAAMDRRWSVKELKHIADRLARAKRLELAAPFARRALELDPTNTSIINLLGRADPAAALVYAERATVELPRSETAWGCVAELRRTVGDKAGAIDAYARAVRLKADEDQFLRLYTCDPQAAIPVMEGLAAQIVHDETLGVLGLAYLLSGRREEAVEAYVRAYRQQPSDCEWPHRLTELAPDFALALLGKDLPDHRNSDEFVGAYANALVATGHRDESYDYYLEAHLLDRDDVEWLRGLADSDPARALPMLERRLLGRPRDASVLGALGDTYATLGRPAEAAAYYERAIALDGDGIWQVALARVEPARAIGMLRAAADKVPRSASAWGHLADAYSEAGKMARARAAYDRALELNPRNSEWASRRIRLR